MSISLAHCRVMIVDDNEFNRKTLAMVLRRADITNIEFAEDGEDGLRKVERFNPDLILLDVEMPNMDGLEMCRRLRALPEHAELPVLFQTVLDSDEEQVRCFAAGGNDFITKPIRPGECVARVRHQLEKRMLFNDLNAFRSRLRDELKQARAMQLSLLPTPESAREVAERYGVVVHSHFETSSELGGDFWQMFPLDEHRLGIFIADFAGHGITAAINTFRLHMLIDQLSDRMISPAGWLGALGAALKEVLPVGQFSTGFYGVIDTETDVLTFAGAGAPPPVVVIGNDIQHLDSSGLVLGVSRKGFYQDRRMPFPPGARLFLYSDALIEARDRNDQALGQENVAPLVSFGCERSPANPLETILEEFFLNRDRPLRDDLTAVWIDRAER